MRDEIKMFKQKNKKRIFVGTVVTSVHCRLGRRLGRS